MNTTKNLYQWDINQRLIDVAGKYVDFPINNEIYRVEVTDGECMIPDELLQSSGRIKTYECMADGTLREFVFDVTERPQPPDYVYTPTERLTFDGLVQKVDDAVADMERRAAAGEFDGNDGYTPVKGKDYFTESEIRQIQNEVSEGAIGELKNTVDFETKKFNGNATEKVNAYNQNDSQKTSAYNQNAQDKLASYNQNATDKTADYNANADSKLSEYNTNVDNKVAEFNLETGKIQTSIKELSQLKPPEAPAVGKVLKVLSVNEDGTFNCVWADDESGAVNDVKINGTSIVDDGVANIPIAGGYNFGVIRAQDVNTSNRGVYISSEGFLSAYNATNKNINARESQNSISPINLDYAVKAAMCDGKGAEWTAEEQAMARKRIGEPQYELIEEIILSEDTDLIVRKKDLDGNLINLKDVIIDFVIPSEANAVNNSYIKINDAEVFYIGGGTSWKYARFNCSVSGGITRAYSYSTTLGYSSPTIKLANRAINLANVSLILISANGSVFKAGTNIKIYGVRL